MDPAEERLRDLIADAHAFSPDSPVVRRMRRDLENYRAGARCRDHGCRECAAGVCSKDHPDLSCGGYA